MSRIRRLLTLVCAGALAAACGDEGPEQDFVLFDADGVRLSLEAAGDRALGATWLDGGVVQLDRNVVQIRLDPPSDVVSSTLLLGGATLTSGPGDLVHVAVLPAGGGTLEASVQLADGTTWRATQELATPDPVFLLPPIVDLPTTLVAGQRFRAECLSQLDEGVGHDLGEPNDYELSLTRAFDGTDVTRLGDGWYRVGTTPEVVATCESSRLGLGPEKVSRVSGNATFSSRATVDGQTEADVLVGTWTEVDCQGFDTDGDPTPYGGVLAVQQGQTTGIEIRGMEFRLTRPLTVDFWCRSSDTAGSQGVRVHGHVDPQLAVLVGIGLMPEDRIEVGVTWTLYSYLVDSFRNPIPNDERFELEILRVVGDQEVDIEDGEWSDESDEESREEFGGEWRRATPHRVGRYRLQFHATRPFAGRELESPPPFYVETYID